MELIHIRHKTQCITFVSLETVLFFLFFPPTYGITLSISERLCLKIHTEKKKLNTERRSKNCAPLIINLKVKEGLAPLIYCHIITKIKVTEKF